MLTSVCIRKTRLVAALLGCFASQHALALQINPGDPGTAGDPASWRTDEFRRAWGLAAIGAEFAYAAGASGDGVRVGMVDSGFYDQHSQLPAPRYVPVPVNGVSGVYNRAYNDSHGTAISGTLGAARDNVASPSNFHGVAFNSNVLMGNTAKTDGALFGGTFPPNATPGQIIDWGYVRDVYNTVNQQNVRIISSSWGSQPNNESYATVESATRAWQTLAAPGTWFQGPLEVAETGTVVVFSAGNTGYPNASPRSGATYFRPDLESNWLAVSGVNQTNQAFNADGSIDVPGTQQYNQCGSAKWGCVTAPGPAVYGARVTTTGPVAEAYGPTGGTSTSAPHASGALAVIMDRFDYLTNAQALDVLKTTARQNATVNDAAGTATPNPTAGERTLVPDSRNGWGTVDLRTAMNGPGQFTGRFAVNTQGQNDIWSNDISDTAIKARRLEDQTEATAWEATKAARGWQNGLPAGATADDRTDFEVGSARQAAREGRVYEGSLAKSGAGSLVLAGDNSYSGGTELSGGTLVGASATAFGTGGVSVSGGTLAVRSDSTLRIGGNLTLGSGSTLDLLLGGGSGSLLDVFGRATFGGLLSLSFLDGFAFGGLGLYDLIGFGSYEGVFSGLSLTGLISGYTADLLYTSGALRLQIAAAVPEPATYTLLLTALGLLAWAAHRRKGVQAHG